MKYILLIQEIQQEVRKRGIRPVLIIQNNIGNKHSTTTIIIPMTKRIEERFAIPTHIRINKFGNKMKYEATIMARTN